MERNKVARKLIEEKIINCMEWYMSPTIESDLIDVMNEYAELVNKTNNIHDVSSSLDDCWNSEEDDHSDEYEDPKDGVIKIINDRINEFVKIHHHFEADELRKACSSIKMLIPPSNFQSEHNDGKITMQDLMLYYSTCEGHDFNTQVIEVINDLNKSKRVGG